MPLPPWKPLPLHAHRHATCACDHCRGKRLAQWSKTSTTTDGSFVVNRLGICSCADHLEYTREHFPARTIRLDGKDCYFCKTEFKSIDDDEDEPKP